MKALVIFLFILTINSCKPEHINTPQAKLLNDSAVKLWAHHREIHKAMQLVNLAVLTDSNYLPALKNKMGLLCELQQLRQALLTAKKIERINPYPELYGGEGILYYKLGHSDSAMMYFNKSLQLYNTILDTMNVENRFYNANVINMGAMLILLDRNEEGIRVLKEIYEKEENVQMKEIISTAMKMNKKDFIDKMWSDNISD